MRTIKFRGQDEHGYWHVGWLAETNDGTIYIAENDEGWTDDGFHNDDFSGWYKVLEKTIGQFTGLLDKNSEEIYEGDIITCINKSDSVYEIGRQMIGFVAYEENGCYWFCKNNFQHYNDWAFADDIEVIGNIHNNPELLKGE